MKKRNRTANAPARIFRQRWPVLTFSLILGTLILLGSIFAWFASSDARTNPFKVPALPFAFEITEEFTPPGIVDPGQNIPKAVSVANTGELPGFVRVLVIAEIIGADGTVLPGNPGAEFTFTGLNTTKWKYGGDGYYYYLDKLVSGETTPALFTGVTLASGLGDEYMNAAMKIDVKLEAVETAKWKYREAWWQGVTPNAAPLSDIDAVLSVLAQ